MNNQFRTVLVPSDEDLNKRLSILRKEGWKLLTMVRGISKTSLHITRRIKENK